MNDREKKAEQFAEKWVGGIRFRDWAEQLQSKSVDELAETLRKFAISAVMGGYGMGVIDAEDVPAGVDSYAGYDPLAEEDLTEEQKAEVAGIDDEDADPEGAFADSR